ncbi:hypothetical protein ACQKWADRAFT_198869 [Trichoderma austrokoningii]
MEIAKAANGIAAFSGICLGWLVVAVKEEMRRRMGYLRGSAAQPLFCRSGFLLYSSIGSITAYPYLILISASELFVRITRNIHVHQSTYLLRKLIMKITSLLVFLPALALALPQQQPQARDVDNNLRRRFSCPSNVQEFCSASNIHSSCENGRFTSSAMDTCKDCHC